MKPTLNSIVDTLLADPNTQVEFVNNEKAGYAIYNNDLNIFINIFSDKQQSYYFEFRYIRQNDNERVMDNCPTYKTHRLGEVRTLLEQIHTLAESTYDRKFSKATSYIGAFKCLLRKEIPANGLSIEETKFTYNLIENNSKVAYLEKSDLTKLATEAEKTNEPTTLIYIPMRGISNIPFMLYIPIPKYALAEYPLMKPEIELKNPNTSTYSLDEVIDNLLSNHNVPETKFHQILRYCKLNNDVEEKTSTNRRAKAKL